MKPKQKDTSTDQSQNNQHKKYAFSSMPIVRQQHRLPDFREIMGQPFISYGSGNDYGDYLVQLFSRSSTHNTVVTGKAGYIFGKGLKLEDDNLANQAKFQLWLEKANSQETQNDIAKKIILDRIIFSGFALLIKRSPFTNKIISVDHLDWTHCRLSVCETKIYYSKNWTYQSSKKPAGSYVQPMRLPNDVVCYDIFDWTNSQVVSVLYFRDYRPQMKGYPVPEYVGANAAIETQAEIDNFHLNNVKTGFSAGTLVVFNNGVPEENAQPKIERKMKDKFTGSTQAGELMTFFSPDKEHGLEVLQLRPNDLDKQFEQLRISTDQSIFVGHRVTSPILFGITTPGSLGQRNEMIDAYDLFQKTYVQEKQHALEELFTDLWHINGGSGKLKFEEATPLKPQLSEQTLIQIADESELRELMGWQPIRPSKEDKAKALPPIATPQGTAPNTQDPTAEEVTTEEESQAKLKGTVGGVQGILSIARSVQLGELTESAAIQLLMSLFGFDEALAKKVIQAPENAPTPQPEEVAKVPTKMSSDNVLKKLSLIGEGSEKYEVVNFRDLKNEDFERLEEIEHEFLKDNFAAELSKDAEKVLSLLIEDSKMSIKTLVEKSGTTEGRVIDAIIELEKNNIIETKSTTSKSGVVEIEREIVKKNVEEPSKGYKIFTKYRYSGVRDERNRPFCAEMLRLNRLYTRKEIDDLSNEEGNSVWLYKGGWYHDPNLDVNFPSCRHMWQVVTVKEKK